MTAIALHTSFNTTTDTNNNDLPPSTPALRQTWTCNNCSITFDTGQAQRAHMKSSWHVYNLKRRIASLPPIPLSVFKGQIETKSDAAKPELIHEDTAEDTHEEVGPPHQCLFCPQMFEDDTEDLENTLDHMYTAHGLFVPDQAMISDLASFVGYLATAVRVWHECLYCGTTRNSTLAIQSHMRDNSHCMLNLEREPELLEFWELMSDEDGDAKQDVSKPQLLSGKELQLRGKTVGSRLDLQRRAGAKAMRARDLRLALRSASESLTPLPESTKKHNSSRQLTRNEEMSIQNLGIQQRHALILAERRSQKDEAIATRAREWAYARRANTQKHDQSHGSLAWAKGGMHNLLPR